MVILRVLHVPQQAGSNTFTRWQSRPSIGASGAKRLFQPIRKSCDAVDLPDYGKSFMMMKEGAVDILSGTGTSGLVEAPSNVTDWHVSPQVLKRHAVAPMDK